MAIPLAEETATVFADPRSRRHLKLASEESLGRPFTAHVADGKRDSSCPIYWTRRSAAADAQVIGMEGGDLSIWRPPAAEARPPTRRRGRFTASDLQAHRAN